MNKDEINITTEENKDKPKEGRREAVWEKEREKKREKYDVLEKYCIHIRQTQDNF